MNYLKKCVISAIKSDIYNTDSYDLGIIIGAYEAIVIHRDVTIPTHRFGHMAHAFILSIVLLL